MMCKLVIKAFERANKLASLIGVTMLIESATSCLSSFIMVKAFQSPGKR